MTSYEMRVLVTGWRCVEHPNIFPVVFSGSCNGLVKCRSTCRHFSSRILVKLRRLESSPKHLSSSVGVPDFVCFVGGR